MSSQLGGYERFLFKCRKKGGGNGFESEKGGEVAHLAGKGARLPTALSSRGEEEEKCTPSYKKEASSAEGSVDPLKGEGGPDCLPSAKERGDQRGKRGRPRSAIPGKDAGGKGSRKPLEGGTPHSLTTSTS